MGLPDLRIIVVPAPLGGLPPEDALKKVDGALEIVGSMFHI